MSPQAILLPVLLLALLACSGGAASPAPVPAAPPPATAAGGCGGVTPDRSGGGTWQCIWSDEFDGSALSSTWRPIPYGLGSSCLFGDAEHAQVGGGELRLIAKPLPPGHWCTTDYGLRYGGGGIQTQGAFAQQYGRFEIRAQMPPGAGFWPAFWLLPDDESFGSEIDIVEMYGGRGVDADSTLHVPAAGPGPQHICPVIPDYWSAFHTYAMEWEHGAMRFFYDGVLCGEFTGMSEAGMAPPRLSPAFDKPHYVLLDLAVQPYWPPDAATPFPGVMRVDYVRVWR